MSLPVSLNSLVRLVPEGVHADDPAAPSYFVRALNPVRKSQMEAAIEADGARPLSHEEIRRRFHRAAAAVLTEEQTAHAMALDSEVRELITTRDRLQAEMALREKERAAVAAEGAVDDESAAPVTGEADPAAAELEAVGVRLLEVAALLEEYDETVAASAASYRRALAMSRLWGRLAPVHAFRYAVERWENVPGEIQRTPDGLVTVDCLRAVPPEHVTEIGWRIWDLIRLSAEQAGN